MTEPRPVGRPKKPSDAEEGYKQEVLAWVQVSTRIRKLIEKQLKFLESQLANSDTGGSTLSMSTMLEVMEGLGKLLVVSSKTVESGIKALERGSGGNNGNEDPDEIARMLQGGNS